jgi:trehalose 6-phosphate synthase/phosphatase
MQILQRYAERTPGAVLEEKGLAIVWHYRKVPPELAYARNLNLRHELGSLLNGTDIGVYNGEKIIEIRPRSISKGAAVDELLALEPADFVLCIGDDYTDEDMFAAAPDSAYTIRVGLEDTLAKHQLASVDQVLKLLRSLQA